MALAQENDYIYVRDFIKAVELTGLCWDDVRLKETFKQLQELPADAKLTHRQFDGLITENVTLLRRALTGSLVVSKWIPFESTVRAIFEETKLNNTGQPSSAPSLSKVDPDLFAVSVCSIDGQRMNLGVFDHEFTAHACAFPLIYLMAVEEYDSKFVHTYVGKEPSGVPYAALTLKTMRKEVPAEDDGLPTAIPHNPMVNAGAMVASSMIGESENLSAAEKFRKFTDTFSRLAANKKVGFSNETFLAERQRADRNFCLAYMMKENNAFHTNKKNVEEVLDLYLQTCSMEVTCEKMAIVAATLANGGVNPLTNDHIFEPAVVRNCLSLMLSCGLYDYSGEWAFTIGLPAKSGICGCIFIVIPNRMGIAVYSPRLDGSYNSARGIEFAKKLVKRFAFHHLDNLRWVVDEEVDTTSLAPCSNPNVVKLNDFSTISLLFAASRGDLNEISRLIEEGIDLTVTDYDKRTALHLAASENRKTLVNFLIHHDDGSYRSFSEINPLDRWNQTPLDDAYRSGHMEIVSMLEAANAKRGTDVLHYLMQ